MKRNPLRIFGFAIAFWLGIFYMVPMNAQDMATVPYDKEVGIRMSSFNGFGMIYKKKKTDIKFRRVRLGVAEIDFGSNNGSQTFKFAVSSAFGIEKRKQLTDKLQFIHGAEFIGNLSINTANSNGNNSGLLSISPGVGFVLGCSYAFSPSLYLSVETIPGISTRFLIDDEGFRNNFNLQAGFNSQAASLSLVYCFNDKNKT